MGPVPGCGDERGEKGPGRLSRRWGWMIVQNKECGNLGDSAGFSLEMVLRSAPSPLRVEGSRPVTKEVVREQRLTFLPRWSSIETSHLACVDLCRDKM